MNTINSFFTLLECPECRAPGQLQTHGDSGNILCAACNKTFPTYFQIPWLFKNHKLYQTQWFAKFQKYSGGCTHKINELREEIKKTEYSPLTKKRLEKLLLAEEHNLRIITELLEPLMLNETDFIDLQAVIQNRVPSKQHVTSYFLNLFRDWSWGVNENKEALEVVSPLLGNLQDKNLLIVGTGASRLAFDVHQRLNPTDTIAVDINPVLLGVAQKLKNGQSLELYEIPLNPGHMDNVAVLRNLSSDLGKKNQFQNLHFLFADGLALPLKAKSIDTLLTPWFIDIVPEDFAILARRMNRFLKTGGTWVNFGPLGFSNPQRPTAYTFEEIKELLEGAGFALEQQVVREIPYLQSPLDIQKRIEKTHSYSAKKIKDCKEPAAHQSLPQWLLKTDLPIPLVPRLVQQGQQSRLHAEILGALDGKRTMGDLQQLVAQHYQITPAQALNLLIQILTPYMEDN